MFKNLKIGGKMTLGLGLILSMLVAVLVGGLWQARQLEQQADDVEYLSNLKAELLQLENKHLNWNSKLTAAMKNGTVKELEIKTDPATCSFGTWYNGEPGKQAEQRLPELKGYFQTLAEPHRLMHESAQQIMEVFQAADSTLPEIMRGLELDHILWGAAVQAAILAKATRLDVEFDHKLCDLGKFLYGEKAKQIAALQPDLGKLFNLIKEPHTALHNSGKVIAGHLAAGNTAAAEQFYVSTIDPLLLENRRILGQIIQTTVTALKGQEQAWQIHKKITNPSLQALQKEFKGLIEVISLAATESHEKSLTQSAWLNKLFISFGIFAAFCSVLIGYLLTRNITFGVNYISAFLETIAVKGNLSADVEQKFIRRGDEIGALAKAAELMLADYRNVEALAGQLGAGNMTADIQIKSPQDSMNQNLAKMLMQINVALSDVNVGATQMNIGTGQIADSAQSLSQGATESAASLEEISSSLEQISSQSSDSASNSSQANQLANSVQEAAQIGNKRMEEMIAAMGEINAAGLDISKIIKVIDEIAFQTNLLALNAAVEAARAGQHGKGFAVVAEEVRNLAARSAKAAAQTTELIEGSTDKTARGTQIAEQTANALDEIIAGVSKVTDLTAEV
ncbi:MAG: methyl-accepting chemotaxis protein, partial [Thermodesulfobacteriota bacterium]|nr:methyl-accepting chemotaxis protein [Thermodesulfobacteriota bacterium]